MNKTEETIAVTKTIDMRFWPQPRLNVAARHRGVLHQPGRKKRKSTNGVNVHVSPQDGRQVLTSLTDCSGPSEEWCCCSWSLKLWLLVGRLKFSRSSASSPSEKNKSSHHSYSMSLQVLDVFVFSRSWVVVVVRLKEAYCQSLDVRPVVSCSHQL